MNEGEIVLINLPQADGKSKLRPALLLKQLPKYNDFLVCGISTQLHQYIQSIDEVLNETDSNFHNTGLHKTSLIRLLFLAVISSQAITGSIGSIEKNLHKNLLQRLSNFIIS